MRIGVPKEIKVHEYRVGMTPISVREAVSRGHEVIIETDAALRQGLSNDDYIKAGASIAGSAAEIFAKADMIVKVKEPQPAECKMLRAGQTLFTYLHLAPDPEQAKALMASGVTAIAYETVTNARGGLPLLAPMSEVAGRMSVQAGAHCLEMEQGGRGMLLGGSAGVPPAKVVVLGGGVSGTNAARMALGLEAEVALLDINLDRLAELKQQLGAGLTTVFSTRQSVEDYVLDADLVIGAVLVPGAEAPKLITRDMVKAMKRGSVIVDISIDQGGCAETSRATTHAAPTFVVDDVVHYCVANMPGAVARTSTFALNNATLPFILALADKGPKRGHGGEPAPARRPQRPCRPHHLRSRRQGAGGRGGAGRRGDRVGTSSSTSLERLRARDAPSAPKARGAAAEGALDNCVRPPTPNPLPARREGKRRPGPTCNLPPPPVRLSPPRATGYNAAHCVASARPSRQPPMQKPRNDRPEARLPKGFQDTGPADARELARMLATIRGVYESYGFEPLETSAIEYTDALGKFLPDQDRPNAGVFSFQDEDDQWLSLRYDLTAPLARYVAENYDRLPKPYRRYATGPGLAQREGGAGPLPPVHPVRRRYRRHRERRGRRRDLHARRRHHGAPRHRARRLRDQGQQPQGARRRDGGGRLRRRRACRGRG